MKAEISKNYNPSEIEDKWYRYWLDHKLFESKPNQQKEPFCIVIPPPNVTGVLHMGHMLNNTVQDVLVRKARMEGKEAVWVPGTDHASIATEAKVVALLKEQGLDKKQLGREKFLEHAFAWKEKYGGIILEQLKKLGASCDWSRTRFTMEPELSKAVISVFVDLYNKGLIYRGIRMVNWDPQGQTALSDEEVIYKEVQSKLYYVRYRLESGKGFLTVATTRPETIMGDTALCVHPEDERYKHLIGQHAVVPLVNRKVRIIADDYIDREFGTGVLKVTPAHDINDYNLGLNNKLQVIDVLNPDGTLSEAAEILVGEDRFVARKRVAKMLEEQELLEKAEDIQNKVGTSERTGAVIEPRISMQWFLKMESLAKPALEVVENDTVKLHPPKFKAMYRSWMENVHDWCISRQLWWGQQIPAFYMKDGTILVAENKKAALKIARDKFQLYALNESDIEQDPDVLDTWFSSWLWPISVFDGFKNPENEDIRYYYPTNDLITAPEILFFWVARMIMAGLEYRKEVPFRNVYLTGIVRDKQGRKMSKSLGNSPDPLELIAKYSADGVRIGMLLSSPAGNDLLFDEKLCEQGRNFTNKIWNAFRLVSGWESDAARPLSDLEKLSTSWMEARMEEALAESQDLFSKYRISDALHVLYKLIWDDFCSFYLELMKPPYGEAIGAEAKTEVLRIFDWLLRFAHPFMPFVTEEIWQQQAERKAGESICVADYPAAGSLIKNPYLLSQVSVVMEELLVPLRNYRNANQISPKTLMEGMQISASHDWAKPFLPLVQKLGNTGDIVFVPALSGQVFAGKRMDWSLPMEERELNEDEKAKLLAELEYTRGFLAQVEQKLSNERFVANAKPELVEKERQKKTDAEAKIAALQKLIFPVNNSKPR
jgi:valyl-tRNA synthetase